MMYTSSMHRTQLYLDDDLWIALQNRAQEEGTSVSDLVRTAARERYMNNIERRTAAMKAFVGIRSDRPEFGDPDFDTEAYIRTLRSSPRRKKALGY